MGLFNELKRRNVIRVGLGYLISAWLIAQVADLVLESINAPEWVMQTILLLVGIGFIVALTIAWAYELTPDGIKKEKDVVRDDSITNITAKKLNYITLIAAIGVLALFVYQQMKPATIVAPTAQAIIPNTNPPIPSTNSVIPVQAGTQSDADKNSEKSIAVLPFVNMSSDKEQDYFADGISEEILNVLVRIPKLKVAGRTSSFSFKGKNQDLREIGDALGVNHILEGSVRRSGARLRITAQLIRSDDGFHLWSDTYDREIADIFDIQDEIAKEVAEQLAISLGLNSKTNAHGRTENLLVYENYLKARQLYLLRGRENLDAALELLYQATTKDPNFAPAWTTTALVYAVYAFYVSEKEQLSNQTQWHAAGMQAAQRAIILDPESGEAQLTLGMFYYYNFELSKAYQQFDLALEFSPDNPIILDQIAQASWQVGYFKQALQFSKKAVANDPLVAMYRNILGVSYGFLGEKDKAVFNYEKAIEIDLTLPFSYYNLSTLYINPGDIDKFIPLIKRGINDGVFSDDRLEKFQSLIDLIANKDLFNDKKALQKMLQETDKLEIKWFLVDYLQDGETLIELLESNSWNKPFRLDLQLFFPKSRFPGIYKNKRWKQQVRKDGVLALWQSRGFPAHCQPIGDDDFECK